ncbi:F-box only protein 36 [Liparis tanakae]|uniref:F-box only protein 36 n=1 Tax=Liparis tanakae TaxID=230148 RepID=A0A4Z2HW90_9TELE|nr:F-box only protein 36 [Liparis tanakae]
MAALLTDPLFEMSGRALTHNNSFNHLVITKSYVIWRWWKISPRLVDRNAKPGELKESHQDFLDDQWVQSKDFIFRTISSQTHANLNCLYAMKRPWGREVSMGFGDRILQYAKALCQGHYDYLERMPDTVLLRIINSLELEDVGQLGRTSRKFRKLCGSEEFWEQAVQRRCNTVSAEMASVALDEGWRSIFFTSKLQLQKLISRRRLKAEEHEGGPGSDPDSKAEEYPDVGWVKKLICKLALEQIALSHRRRGSERR